MTSAAGGPAKGEGLYVGGMVISGRPGQVQNAAQPARSDRAATFQPPHAGHPDHALRTASRSQPFASPCKLLGGHRQSPAEKLTRAIKPYFLSTTAPISTSVPEPSSAFSTEIVILPPDAVLPSMITPLPFFASCSPAILDL
jgi:hypothetical protein